MSEHTAIPWIYQERSDDYTHIIRDKNHRYICGCSQTSDGTGEANAKFIVRACNSHDALVGALSSISSLIGNVDHSKGHGENSAQMRGYLLNDIRTIAEQALAAAKGETP